MNARIRELRKSLSLSQKDFAEKIGLKQNAISHIEKEGTTITEQNIKNICHVFSVNEEWLRTGYGNMFLEETKKSKEFFEIFDKLSPILQDYLIKTSQELLDVQYKFEKQSDIYK